MANKIKWEVVEDTRTTGGFGYLTLRVLVPGSGWLVRTTYRSQGLGDAAMSSVFVPDPDGKWLAK